ncbi:hypothetical protein D9M71_458710 [compost metagenome]
MIRYRSMPVCTPMRSSTATNTSSGVLPAPAPRPATEPSMRTAPASMAASELAMAMPMLWWPWKPTWVAGFSSARSRPIFWLTSSGSM